MAKKVILKDDNVEIMPITRGELVLDSSGQLAFHSSQFLATQSLPGLMSAADKTKLDAIKSTTIDSALSTTSDNAVKNKVVTAAINEAKTLANNAQDAANNTLDTANSAQGIANAIKSSYLKSASVSGNLLTLTDLDDEETKFNNTTYTFNSGSDGSFTVTPAGGEALTITVGGVLTDNKVKQTNTTSNGNYRLLFSYTADNTTRTEEARKSSKLLFNPSTGALTATSFSGKLAWANLTDVPESFTPSTHNHSTAQIDALTNYSKATSPSDLAATDTLNAALGKLEYKADTAYDWIISVTTEDTDKYVNKWQEILDFLNKIDNTDGADLTDEFVTRKTNLEITGTKTFTSKIHISSSSDNKLILNNTLESESKIQGIGFQQNGVNYGLLGTWGSDDLEWNRKKILHSGNYTLYTPILNSSSTHATSASVIYAPSTAGTKGLILTSNGSGAPVWSNSVGIANNGIFYIEGTGTTAGTWLGSHTGIASYYKGLTISYKIPVAGAATTTLNINSLGAITCYINTSKLTTHYGVGSVAILVYDGTYFRAADYWDGNSYAYVRLYLTDTTATEYPLLFRYNTDVPTSYVTLYTRYDSAITVNPSTNAITASLFKGSLGDGTMTVKPEFNNKVNFGGTNNSATIYFGYRATDSKPIPTKFVFGSSTGTADILANKFIKKGGTSTLFLKADGSIDSNTYLTSRGYIGTTAVLASSAIQNLTGIGSASFSGTISFNDTASARISPMIKFGSSNQDTIIWRVYSSDNNYADQGVYGFDMTYTGTGSGNNKLILYADNQTSATKVAAMTVTNAGVVSFVNNITSAGFVKSGSSDSYVLLGGGGHKTISSLSVASANKLTTARTIWGQSFDGTGDVYGDLVLYGTSENNINAASGKLWFNGIPNAGYGNGVYITGIHYGTYGRKRLAVYQSNTLSYTPTWTEVFTILPDGNVGIGTVSPTATLQVVGGIRSNETQFTNLGSGTYDVSSLSNHPTYGLQIEGPLKSDSSSADKYPITLTWRGGYSSKGGLQILDSSHATLGGNAIIHAGNWPSYIGGDGFVMRCYVIDARSLNTNTWYPVTMDLGWDGRVVRIEVRCYLLGNKPSWATHASGFTTIKVWETHGYGWGSANGVYRTVYQSNCSWCDTDPVRGIGLMGNSNQEFVYVRGGGYYYFYTSHNTTPILRTSTFSQSSESIGPTTSTPAGIGAFATSYNMHASHFYENSDIRFKDVEDDVNISSLQLSKLPLFNFKWNNKHDNDVHTGSSALEVQKLLPTIVHENNDMLTLDYGVLGTVAGITACRELTKHEQEIKKLQNRISELEEKIEDFKNKN